MLELMELARTDFRTSRQADEINSRFQNLLGLPHRYGPARLGIGLSLSIEEPPEFSDELAEDMGKPIKGENLFGTGVDLSTWITLMVQRSGLRNPAKRDLQTTVAAHWHR